ncbi:MAG: permease [Planctomycetes bacterium]|nr:permease [Planctomycetota bacterium]
MDQQVLDFLKDFTSILWEAFPFIVLGALIAGILEEVVPQQAIARFVPKSKFIAVCLGGTLGLVFPMCECGIVPVMRRLIRKGLPLGTCVAYMMAGPIINLIVIGSTWVAFGPHGIAPQMTFLRIGLGFVVAVVTGLLVEIQYRKYGNDLLTPTARPQQKETVHEDLPVTPDVHPAELRAGERRPLLQRLGNISETALHDFKDIMVFLMLGAFLASFVKLYVTNDQIGQLSTGYPALIILAMMAMAILMCLCSEADAFVAASFTTMHPSAKLAFLVLGPMLDLKLLMMFTRVFRKRLIVLIVISAIVQVFIYTLIVHYVWQQLQIPYGANRTVNVDALPVITP